MKNALLILFLLGLLGSIGIYFYSNKTQIEYYANGRIKSETSRAMFKKNGLHREYYEDGPVKLSVNYINDQKSGKQISFLPNGDKIETLYKNNQISGIQTYFNPSNEKTRLIAYTNGKKNGITKLFDQNGKTVDFFFVSGKIDGKFSFLKQFDGTITNNNVTIKSPEKSDVKYDITAQIICDADKLIDAVAAYIQNKNTQTTEEFLGCLSFSEATYETESFQLSFKGNVAYPKFSKDSALTIHFKNKESLMSNLPFKLDEANDFIYVLFKGNNKDISVQYFSEDNKNLLTATFNGKEDVLKGLTTFVQDNLWHQDNLKAEPVENLTLKTLQIFNTEQKLIADFKGSFNLYKAFEKPSQFELLNAQNKPWITLKTNRDAVDISILYPLTLRPFISAKITVTDDLKEVYHMVMNSVQYLDKLGVMDEIQNNSTRITEGVSLQDLIIYDEQGNTSLKINAHFKPNTQIYNVLQNPIEYVWGTVDFYQNKQIIHKMEATKNDTVVLQIPNDNLAGIIEMHQEKTSNILNQLKNYFQKTAATTFEPFLYETEKMLLKENPNALITHEFTDALNYYRSEQIAKLTKRYAEFLLKYLSEQKQNSNTDKTITETGRTTKIIVVPTIQETGLANNINYLQNAKIVYVPKVPNPFATNTDVTLKLTFTTLPVCLQTTQLLGVPNLCRKEDLSFNYTVSQ